LKRLNFDPDLNNPVNSINQFFKMNNTNTIKRNEWLIKQYFSEVWNKGNIDMLDALLSPGYLNHSSSIPDSPPGPEGLKPIVAAMRHAFPDLHYEIKDLVITNYRVVARVLMTGTHKGDFFGLAPTHRKIMVNQVNIEYISAGRISEHWRVTEELSIMKQLGVIPV
jgi:steroid delta-isomerase-like uncharacterized protein